MAAAHIIDRITKDLAELVKYPFDSTTLQIAINRTGAILAMALVQDEIDWYDKIESSLEQNKTTMVVTAEIDDSEFKWTVIKKIAASKNANDAYDRAMRGI
jgi:uncharacterized membrane-anchored protein